MKVTAAVAWKAGSPLSIEVIDLDGPKHGEVLIRHIAAGVCHTDAFTLSGDDPEGIFPAVLGHEAGAVVEEIGPGVTSVQVGDHVIPLCIRQNVDSANSVYPAKPIYAKPYAPHKVRALCQMERQGSQKMASLFIITWGPLLSPNTPYCPKYHWLKLTKPHR